MYTVSTLPQSSTPIAPGFQAKAADEGTVDPEIVRLKQTHPLWNIYSPEWEMYLAAYEGGPDFANPTNLFKHQRENDADYLDRTRRVHYFNYCEPLTDFFTNFIFTETIQRDGGTNVDWYSKFITDVNRKGDSVTDYMKMVSDDMQIYGMSYTMVDTPDTNGVTLTVQDEEDLGIRPYWVLIKPNEIVDWDTDDFDQLTYVKRRQPITKRIDSGIVHLDKYTEIYTDKVKVTIVNDSGLEKPEIIEQKETGNSFGMVPIVCVRYKRSKRHPFMGNSFLRDFAYNNREVMNYTSLLQEFLYRQCFNLLAKESDTTIPYRDQEDGSIGTSNVLEYPKGASPPQYISPPTTPAQFIQDERSRIVNEMFKRASQDMLNELFNGEKSSGFSQAQSFSKTVPFIATRADTLEKAEIAFMSLTMKAVGKAWDGKVKYKDRYELTNITDAISQLTMVFKDLMLPSETFVKEELKRLVHELDGKIPADKMAKVIKEIEGMDFDGWQETMKLSLIGNAGRPAGQTGSKPNQPTTTAEAAAESKTANNSSSSKTSKKK